MKISINAMSKQSLEDAVKSVESFREKVVKLTELLPKALAEFGAVRAKVLYDESPYNEDPSNVSVRAEPTENGWLVLAEGEAVCFVEFGAGVHYNGNESYRGIRPPGIVGIGEYGDGRGKQDVWAYGKVKPVKWTHGTPASNSLYYTASEMEQRITETARKILND